VKGTIPRFCTYNLLLINQMSYPRLFERSDAGERNSLQKRLKNVVQELFDLLLLNRGS